MEIHIPQHPPFVMVDKLLHSDSQTTRTAFGIRADNVLVDNGVFSAAGMMENIAQTVAAGASPASVGAGVADTAAHARQPAAPGYIVSVKNLEITALPQVGDELITEITIEARVLDIVVISGKVTCNGITLAQCEMKILIPV